MLTVNTADAGGVIHRAIVLVALVCSALIFASFVIFARDQINEAAKHQANEVAAAPANRHTAPQSQQQGQPGRFIERAASDLTSPFRSVVQSSSAWVQHGVPTALGLLLYGVGLGFLARFSRGSA
jgi:hypothetical protein